MKTYKFFKKVILTIVLFFSISLFFSFVSYKETNELENQCYVSNNYSSYGVYTVETRRGDACGNSNSLRIYYTNHRDYSVRVAFYMPDEYGQYSKYHPYTVTVGAGKRTNHHTCSSNGRYEILVAGTDTNCKFPKYSSY